MTIISVLGGTVLAMILLMVYSLCKISQLADLSAEQCLMEKRLHKFVEKSR